LTRDLAFLTRGRPLIEFLEGFGEEAGSIINVASVAGHIPLIGGGPTAPPRRV